ncbi:MAG: peroxide stress protein YaaA [Pseudomonadales bacterium]
MLVVISPAKTLDFETPARTTVSSMPRFLDDSQTLVERMRELAPADIAKLMKISDKLSVLNSTRYEIWSLPFTPDNAKQALLAFKGDVYTGLDAETLTPEQDNYAQQHLRILSGLYGIVKPLDLIQPYRLEMGTKLSNTRGNNLYQFWGDKITDSLNAELDQNDVLINLASNEYFKSVQPKNLNARIITPVFKDTKHGVQKIISFYAKKARGLMVRYMIDNQVDNAEVLKDFDIAGYQFEASQSSANEWVFTRPEQ